MIKKRKSLIILYPLLLMILLASCNQESSPDYEYDEGRLARNGSYINEASEQLTVGNLELALINFEQAILHEEELALAWRGVGLIRFRQNEFGEARTALETSLELGGEPTAIIYNLLGVTAMRASDFQDAIDYFDAGIRLFNLTLEEGEITLLDLMEEDRLQSELEGTRVEVLQSMMYNRILAHQNLANWDVARELAGSYLQIFPDDTVIQREYDFLQTR
jgi:tetratricopeptide (TPR) repeat protein